MSDAARIPTYRLHRASGQAVVVLSGKSIYLGKYNTSSSRAEYRRVLAEWLANNRLRPNTVVNASTITPSELTVTELTVAYWTFVKTYYVKDGAPTSEQDTIRQALRFIRRSHGLIRAVDFGPLSLKAVREAMVTHPVTRLVKEMDKATKKVRKVEKLYRTGLARGFINKQVSRIKRMFKWAAENELLPVAVHQALATVPGLRKDRTNAREKAPIRPVSDAHVDTTLAQLKPTIRVMVLVQRLCGGRPQDIVCMRPCDIDRSGPVWEYRPGRHKTEHCNRERVVHLGPQAQQMLMPFLNNIDDREYVFSPSRRCVPQASGRINLEATSMPTATESAAGKMLTIDKKLAATKKPPAVKRRGKHAPRDHYDAGSYRRAIRRACERAGVPVWCPLQLRHAAGTLIRKRFGLEASQAVLGHAELSVTQVYSEVDLEKARQIMAEIG